MVLRAYHKTGDSKIKNSIEIDEETCVKRPLIIFQTREKTKNIISDLTSKQGFSSITLVWDDHIKKKIAVLVGMGWGTSGYFSFY
jgi:hypothetical protein